MKKMFGKAKRILIASLVFVFTFSLLTPAVPVFAAQGLTIDLKSSALGSGENVFWGVDRYDSNANSSLLKLQTYNAGTYTDKFRVDTSGNVSALGDVCGNGKCLSSSASQWSGSGPIYYNGSVGIGITTPGYTLDVNGTAYMETARVKFVGGTNYNENIRMYPGSNDYSSLIFGAVSGDIGTGVGQWSLVRYPSANSYLFGVRYNSSDFFNITSGGNVGIGNSNPGYKLEAVGDIFNTAPSQGNLGLSGLLPGYGANTYPTLKTSGNDMYFSVRNFYSGYIESDASGNTLMELSAAGPTFNKIRFNTNGPTLLNGGNVGIGITNPTAKLQVQGPTAPNSTALSSQVYIGKFLYNEAGGNQYGLTMKSLRESTSGTWYDAGVRLAATVASDGYSIDNFYNNLSWIDFYGSGYSNALRFGTNNSERMRIDVNGKVGVGMTNPGATFHVAGSIGATSWIGAGCEAGYACDNGGGYVLNYADGHTDATSYANYPTYRLSGGTTYGLGVQSNANSGFFDTVDSGSASDILEMVYYSGVGVKVGSTAGSDKYLDVMGDIRADGNTVIDNGGGWHRTYGNTGWYNQTWGGGMYMQDSSWVRTYGNKNFYVNQQIRGATSVNANDLDEAYAGAGGMNSSYYHTTRNDSWFPYPGNNYNYIRGNTYIGNENGIITTSGRIGIGTTDPSSYRIYGRDSNSSWAYRYDNTYNGSNIHVAHGGGYGLHVNAGTNANGSTYILELYSANGIGDNTKMMVMGDGSVGIGKANPSHKLDVVGDIYSSDSISTGGYLWSSGSIYSYGTIYSYGDIYATGGLTMPYGNITTSDGTIEATAAGAYDAIRGISSSANQSGVYGRNTNGSGFAGYFYGRVMIEGAAYSSSGAWSGSDVRWKKNIAPLQGSLDKVLSLRGVSFDWNTKDYPDKNFKDGKQIGFIAQEVEKVVPEVVSTDEKGYKSLSYDKLTSVLVEAVKEQQKQIENKQQQLDNQQKEIDYLKGEIKNLQK